MKKKLIIMLASVMAMVLFAACSSEDEPATVPDVEPSDESVAPEEEPATDDTTDTAEEDQVYTVITDAATIEANDGSVQSLIAVVRNGEIVDVTFSYKDADGNEKAMLSAEEYPMTPHPSEWVPLLDEQLTAAGVDSAIEGVVGATSTSDIVKVLQTSLIEYILSNESGGTLEVAVPAKA